MSFLLALLIVRYTVVPRMGSSVLVISDPEYHLLQSLQERNRAREWQAQNRYKAKDRGGETLIHPFPFDPNQVSREMLDSLGLPPYIADRWLAFLASGAVIRNAGDIGRIYGMKGEWAAKLSEVARFPERRSYGYTSFSPSRQIIELNAADSTQLLTLPGIGPVFARRIIEYRDKLGGFSSTEQLLGVYGMDSTRFEGLQGQVMTDTTLIDMLNINEATFATIRKHPLLGYTMAYEIIEYRRLYGRIVNPDEINGIRNMDPLKKEVVLKYLSVK